MPPSLTDYTFALDETGMILNADNSSVLPFVDVTGITGLDTAPLRTTADDRQGMDGTYVDASNQSMRTVVLNGILYANPNDSDSTCDALKAAYSDSTVRPFYFKLPGKSLRFVNAQGGGAQYAIDTNRRLGLTPIQLTLLCADPYIYDYPAMKSGPVTSGGSLSPTVLNPNGSFESGISGWTARHNAVLSQSGVQAFAGSFSMLITPDGVTNGPGANTPTGLSGFPVIPGNSYTINGNVFCSAAWASGSQVIINWYDNTGAFLSNASPTAVALSATTWTPLTVTGTAPQGAATAAMILQAAGTPSAATLFYFDECYLLADVGMGFPVGFNMGFGANLALPSIVLVNNGTHTAYPVLTLQGPLTNPVIVDTVNNIAMRFTISLTATDSLVIDCRNKTITLNGQVSRRSALVGLQWFSVPKQTSDTFLLSADSGTGSLSGILYSTYY